MTPQSTPGRLSFSLPLDAARLQRARQRLRDYLHEHLVDADAVDDIVLAVEEAVTNAVRHSGAADDVLIDVEFQGPDLCVSVGDRGVGFDVSAFDASGPPDLDSAGGRGLYLIAGVMDELALSSDGQGVTVRAVKRGVLRAADAGDAPVRG